MVKLPTTLTQISLELGNIPTPKVIIRKTIGRRTKMGFIEFVAHLLDWNEDNRQTDAKLQAMILDEFGHSTKTVQSIQDGCSSISKFRNEYNKGLYRSFLVNGKVPRMSFKYGESRLPMDYSRPSHVISNGRVREYREKFPVVAETADEILARFGRDKANWSDDSATV